MIGYSVDRKLYESCIDLALADLVGEHHRPVLIVQLGRRADLRREYGELIDVFRRAGCSATSRVIPGNESWWFSNDPTRAAPISTHVIDATSDWLANALEGLAGD